MHPWSVNMALYALGEVCMLAIYTSKNYNPPPAMDAMVKLEVSPHIQRKHVWPLYMMARVVHHPSVF